MATRPSVDVPFDTVTSLGAGVNSSNREGGPNVSHDGLALYFHSDRQSGSDHDLYRATRTSINAEFGSAEHLGNDINSPSPDRRAAVSSDQLTLFFESTRPGGASPYGDLWVSMRSNTSEPFGPAVRVDEFSLGSHLSGDALIYDPYLSADWPKVGSKIYYGHFRTGQSSDVFEATWVTWLGDANLDGQFDENDLVDVFEAGEYEDEIEMNSRWSTGDWDLD